MIYNDSPEFLGPIKSKWLDLSVTPGTVDHQEGRVYWDTDRSTIAI